MDFATMMALEPHGPDTFVGAGPVYPWGGLYGGQIVAQGLAAAASSVAPEFSVHSLHAYFIRLGDSAEPIRFEVDRVRNGRTFATRSVTVRQHVGAILNMAVSFQVDEGGIDVQTAPALEAPEPEGLSEDSWTPVFRRRTVRREGEAGRATAWFEMSDALGDDPIIHACALAFASDDLPTEAVLNQHPQRPTLGVDDASFWSASLDHTIWFHRPFEADRWHLHDFTCHGLLGSRGLSVGNVFTPEGRHVATVAQEVLLRPAKRAR